MTNQEAIWRLKEHFRIHEDGWPTPYLNEAAEMAYTALEKQIPKIPERDEYGHVHCPSCGYRGICYKVQDSEHHLNLYCENCGQALDWKRYCKRRQTDMFKKARQK